MPFSTSNHAVVFIEGSYNRYSLAVLTGAFETDERFREVDLHFLKNTTVHQGDAQFDRHLSEHLLMLTRRYEKLVVAFSFHTPNVIAMWKMIGGLRTRFTHNKIEHVLMVAGGPHPSGDPEGTLRLGVDVVVIGEGEVTFPNLVERFLNGEDYSEIRGLSFFDSTGQYQYTGSPDPIDLNQFPPFAPKHSRFCPIEISRGCPWACKFCQTPFFMGTLIRHRSIEHIVEFAQLAKQRGFRDLRFISPNAFAYGSPDGRTVHPEILEALLKAVSDIYGHDHVFFGSFPSEVRPEHVSPETLTLIQTYCANDNLVIGAQSGSEAMLQAIHRGHGVDEVIRATELILAAGLTVHVDFIFGLPGETHQDREQTLALITRLSNMGARIHSHTFMPLVGTPLANCQPGVVDQPTRRLIESLRGKKLESGYWKKQELIGKQTTAFLLSQRKRK